MTCVRNLKKGSQPGSGMPSLAHKIRESAIRDLSTVHCAGLGSFAVAAPPKWRAASGHPLIETAPTKHWKAVFQICPLGLPRGAIGSEIGCTKAPTRSPDRYELASFSRPRLSCLTAIRIRSVRQAVSWKTAAQDPRCPVSRLRPLSEISAAFAPCRRPAVSRWKLHRPAGGS